MSVNTKIVEFGPFRLSIAERRLLKDGVAMDLDDRTLDVLIFLVERAGIPVTEAELVAAIRSQADSEGSDLSARIAALRQVLDDGQEGAGYISEAGEGGYRFSPDARTGQPAGDVVSQVAGLPQKLTRIVGREGDARDISGLLTARRFVTIHGSGGIGKTTVGLSVANGLADTFPDGLCFLDLASCNAGENLPNLLVTALGLSPQLDDPLDKLLGYLKGRHMLLVFDCCEHLIDHAAQLAELIFHKAPRVSILATSREPLRAEGEHVYVLGPLAIPPESGVETLDALLNYPAASLFLERAVAGGLRAELTSGEIRIVAGICRKVEGIALALELVAGRVNTHGLRETAELLDGHLKLLWQGRRTAVPRHQTLNATLAWSHELIGIRERVVLRRLSVFSGHFTLREAQAIASGEDVDAPGVIEALGQLVQKSLVNIVPGDTTRYRLLDTTRAYAKARLVESGEEAATARRHASHYQQWLAGGYADVWEHPHQRDLLGNICGALGWSFSEQGDADLAILLAVHSVGLFKDLAMLAECRFWCERALSSPGPDLIGSRHELVLREALAHAYMFAVDNSEEVRVMIERALEVAQLLDDSASEFRLITILNIYHRRNADFRNLLPLAQRAKLLAPRMANADAAVTADVMAGVAYHLAGQLPEAWTELRSATRYSADFGQSKEGPLSASQEARFIAARTLWLQGLPDRAADLVREAERVEQTNPLAACQALILASGVFHFRRDWTVFEGYLARLEEYAFTRSFGPYKSLVAGFRGELLYRTGNVDDGVALMKEAVGKLLRERYLMYVPWINSSLAEALACRGYFDQALGIMNDVIAGAEERGGGYLMPELLRVNGEIFAQAGNDNEAELCFMRSISIAGIQTAQSWQLRASTSFTRLMARQQRRDEARLMLEEIYGKFTEGFDTADLTAARLLLETLD